MDTSTISCKAWRYHSSGRITDLLRLDDVAISSKPSHVSRLLSATLGSYGPQPGIIIQVAVMSLNPSDYKLIQPGLFSVFIRNPGIPGSDFSGVIIGWLGNKKDKHSQELGLEIGSKVYGHLTTEWRILVGTGTLSQYIVAYPPIILPIPPSLSFEQASSAFLVGVTNWQALVEHGKLKSGQRVFVNGGSGGTGVWAIQIARALGAYVVATCSPSSKEMLESINTDELIDYQTISLIPHLIEHYSTSSTQFDIVYDCIGSQPEFFNASPAFLRPGGRFIDIAAMANSKGISGSVRDASTVVKNVTLPRLFGGTPRKYIPIVLRAASGGKAFKDLDALLRAGKIKPVLDSVYSFEDAVAAYERLMTGRAKGKVVIRVSQELCEARTSQQSSD